jgi:hypothetical protein
MIRRNLSPPRVSNDAQRRIMSRKRRISPTPATAIALLALFFALGGSAFAVGQQLTAAQPRCANGAVRGIATVVGDSTGMANVPDTFTSRKAIFKRTFNCTGRGVQVRRISVGVYEVRFVGNSAPTALATGVAGGEASAEAASPGVFRVNVYPSGRADPEDRGFSIVAV